MDLTHGPKPRRAFTPFNAASERFPSRASSAGAPGYYLTSINLQIDHDYILNYFRPGSYECDVKQNRQVQMLHSFGGRTKLIPAVKTKCMPLNNDKV